MSKLLPFAQAVTNPAIVRQMASIFHSTNPAIAFLSPKYLEFIGIKDLAIHERFNGHDSCHHASELLYYLLNKSDSTLNLQFINFRQQRHCFLTSEDGETIIDPTWKQFLSPDEFYKKIRLFYGNSQHLKECAKFLDYRSLDKKALRDVELKLIAEDTIFVGNKKEMDEKFAHFVTSFNQAYDISSPEFDKKVLDNIKSFFPENPQEYKASSPMLALYIKGELSMPQRFEEFVRNIIKAATATPSAQPLKGRSCDLTRD